MIDVNERVRRHRARLKTGAAVVPFVILQDEVATVELLIASGLLDPGQRDDKAAMAVAVGSLLDFYAAQHKTGLPPP